jgi:hypothetical protein
VSAAVTWRVEWAATDGQYGRFDMVVESVDNPSIHVGELRAVIVPNGG